MFTRTLLIEITQINLAGVSTLKMFSQELKKLNDPYAKGT